MSQAPAVARTPGATRAGPGEYLFDLAKILHERSCFRRFRFGQNCRYDF